MIIEKRKGDKMKIKKGFVRREIAGKMVVVPTGKENVDKRIIITLNQTANDIWDCIKGGKTISEIAEYLVSVYDVEYEKALKSVNDFVLKLKENDFLED